MNNRVSCLAAVLLAVFVLLSSATSQAENRGDTLLKEVDQQMNPTSYETYFQIINKMPNGKENRITAYSAKQGDGKAVVLIVAPQELQGRAVLRRGEEVWTHFPGETKLRQSTLRHAFIGGVFNNIDYLATSFAIDHQARLIKEDKKQFILELTPKTDDIPYRSIELVVDKKSMRPVKLVQFASPGVVIKTVTFDHSRLSKDGKTVLTAIKTEAEANRLYRSIIQTGNTKEREFPNSTFTKELLPRLGSIMR